MSPRVVEDAGEKSVPPQPASGWPVDPILQWFGVASLGLILLINFPFLRFQPAYLLAWTMEAWVVLLAAFLNVVVYGIVTRQPAARAMGVAGAIACLLLTPGSPFLTVFFSSTGGWLVLMAVLLLGTGELIHWTLPRPEPESEQL